MKTVEFGGLQGISQRRRMVVGLADSVCLVHAIVKPTIDLVHTIVKPIGLLALWAKITRLSRAVVRLGLKTMFYPRVKTPSMRLRGNRVTGRQVVFG